MISAWAVESWLAIGALAARATTAPAEFTITAPTGTSPTAYACRAQSSACAIQARSVSSAIRAAACVLRTECATIVGARINSVVCGDGHRLRGECLHV